MKKWDGEEKILELLADGEGRTPNEVAKKVGINQHTAQRVMEELAKSGKLRHKKMGRYRIYWLWRGGAWAAPGEATALQSERSERS